MSQSHGLIGKYDDMAEGGAAAQELCEKANLEIAAMLKKETDNALSNVLFEASSEMKNAFARSDA